MLSDTLNIIHVKKQISDVIESLKKEDNSSYFKVKEIEDFHNNKVLELKNEMQNTHFEKLTDADFYLMFNQVLTENKSVELYLSYPNKITTNQILSIEEDKYILYLAKLNKILTHEEIENMFLLMPPKIRKKYALKKLNKEAFNKNIRFSSAN